MTKKNSAENPWTTLDETEVYDNAWIRVSHRNVLNPAGGAGIYGVVHFKNVAIGVVPIDENGDTWLVGQFRYTLDEYSWEIPEGGCPAGESEIETAQRELLEETGLRAEKWTKLADLHTSNSVTDERGVLFIAQNLTFGEADPEETEALEIRKLPLAEAVEMVFRSEITDSMSQTGLLMAHELWKNGRLT